MIARIWRGTTSDTHADTYMDYLRETGLDAYEATAGNKGVFVLRRIADGKAEFVLISLWDSFEAIRDFAGPEPEKAVYYPRDDEYLLERQPGVDHYEVLAAPLPSQDETKA